MKGVGDLLKTIVAAVLTFGLLVAGLPSPASAHPACELIVGINDVSDDDTLLVSTDWAFNCGGVLWRDATVTCALQSPSGVNVYSGMWDVDPPAASWGPVVHFVDAYGVGTYKFQCQVSIWHIDGHMSSGAGTAYDFVIWAPIDPEGIAGPTLPAE